MRAKNVSEGYQAVDEPELELEKPLDPLEPDEELDPDERELELPLDELPEYD